MKFGYCECSATGRGTVIRGYHCGLAVEGDSCAALPVESGMEVLVGRPSCGGFQAVVERRRCQSVGLAGTPCCPTDRLRVSRIPARLAVAVVDMGREPSAEETGWRGMIDVSKGERGSSSVLVPGGFKNVFASLFTWKDVGGPSTPIVTIMTSRSRTTT